MSRIAVLRANSNQVKQFAQRVADDHNRANRKLKEIAWSKDLEVCNEMDQRRAKLLLALQRHTGDDFDREYLTLQVDQHRRVVRLFQQHAQRGSDEDLRNFAQAKLAALEAHLQEASLLADSR
jgi:putative membrane protein